ncbi:MAG TPA: hypothetical protein PLP91_11980 [Plasticicumulans sp.]|nr:hypothetical protein [Plasticicumulans sp.]
MKHSALVVALVALSCEQQPGPLVPIPNAVLAAPTVKVSPPPGPFNGTLDVTFVRAS